MNILVTGAKGFIGRNLVSTLHNIQEGKDRSFHLNMDLTVFQYDVDTDPELLDLYCKKRGFCVSSGRNQPASGSESVYGRELWVFICIAGIVKKHENYCPVMVSSSIQASLDNPYGKVRKQERMRFSNMEKTMGRMFISTAFQMSLVNGAGRITTVLWPHSVIIYHGICQFRSMILR